MSAALALALAGMLCVGVSDLVYKQGASAGVPARQFLMVQTWFFTSAVLLYGLVTRTLMARPAALWGAVGAVFAFTGFYNFARSLHSGLVSVCAPLFRLSFVGTAFLAILLLGEPFTWRKGLGIASALVAVWLLLGAAARVAPTAGRVRRASLARVSIATAAVAVANLVYKVGLRAGATAASLLVTQACVATGLALGLVLVTEGEVRVPPATWRYSGGAGVVLATAFVCMMEALARGQASVVVPITQMGFVVTALLGMLLLKEPFTPRKGLGLAAALAAILFLAGP
ncbi:MAG TPA: EamA family transporter [Candidatus Methylomirabilis sp.]